MSAPRKRVPSPAVLEIEAQRERDDKLRKEAEEAGHSTDICHCGSPIYCHDIDGLTYCASDALHSARALQAEIALRLKDTL